MTVACALARDGHVWMAADSLTNVYDRPIVGGATKIRRLTTRAADGQVLIATSGDAALLPTITRHLTVESLPRAEDAQQWAEAIAEAISDIAHDHRIVNDSGTDGTVLLAATGHLWTMNDAAVAHADGVAAIGSGEGPAIGAIDAMLRNLDAPLNGHAATNIVRAAAEIACTRDRYCAPPIQLEQI